MTISPVRPDRVYALVVGIEKYAAGGDYDLDGPAQDALAFCDWLLAQGIDPGHIYLFLSPLEKNEQVTSIALTKGLQPKPANHDLITHTIRSQFTNDSNQGDLLYVFWGGHGFVTNTDGLSRRLLFADTDDHTKWNLNVNSIVNALGTSAYRAGFAQQIIVIDACANAFHQGLAQTIQWEAAEVKFAVSGESERHEQFVLFAAPEYEVALNSSGTGHFSQAVLKELTGQPLVPDMRALAGRIEADFLEQQKGSPVYWFKIGDNQTVGEHYGINSALQTLQHDWRKICRDLLRHWQELTTNALMNRHGVGFQVDEIFIPLGVVERRRSLKHRSNDHFLAEQGLELFEEKITPISQNDFFEQVLHQQQSKNSQGRRIAIIGEPGSGKTTQLQKIGHWILEETDGIPIWIPLAAVGTKTVREYLLDVWLQAATQDIEVSQAHRDELGQLLKTGRVWLLLDGVDEMSIANALSKIDTQISEGWLQDV